MSRTWQRRASCGLSMLVSPCPPACVPWRLKQSKVDDALVAGLLDVAHEKGVHGVLGAVEQRALAGVLILEHQRAARLARILARVHEHHRLVPRAQAVRDLATGQAVGDQALRSALLCSPQGSTRLATT